METRLSLSRESFQEHTFKKEHKYTKPTWIAGFRWKEIFDQAFKEEEASGWQEVSAKQLLSHGASQDEYTDQQMCDYHWELTMRKMMHAFKKSFRKALEMIPLDFEDEVEKRRVEHLASHDCDSRLSSATRTAREYPRRKKFESICQRKVQKRLGRAMELRLAMERTQDVHKVMTLANKVFGTLDFEIDELDRMIQEDKETLKKIENESKNAALNIWKKQMREDVGKRSNWIEKKKTSFSPSVGTPDDHSRSKDEAVQKFKDHIEELHRKVEWEEDELRLRTSELKEFYRSKFRGKVDRGGMEIEMLKKTIGKSNGTAGLDQWSAEELKVLAQSDAALETVFEAMQMWMEFETTPEIVKETKMVYIPKRSGEKCLAPKDWRPITVYSIWWRIWTSAMIQSPMVRSITKQFPSAVFGGPGGAGTEVRAAVLDSLAKKWGFLAALDYSHCFDTVSQRLLRDALMKGLPPHCKPWLKVLFNQWGSSRRWICYDKHFGAIPVVSEVGIPQGDATSPLMLTLLMIKAYDEAMNLPLREGQKLFVNLYMDDRAIVCNDCQLLRFVVQQWKNFSERFHLLENEAKEQWVSCQQPLPEGFSTHAEVLGAVIGLPSQREFQRHAKNAKRIDHARKVCGRIRILPRTQHAKMDDLTRFASSAGLFGWIAGNPKESDIKQYNGSLWKALGRTGYSVGLLRTILTGVHVEFEASLNRRLHIMAKRNRLLAEINEQAPFDGLNRMVLEQLEDCGFFQSGENWIHQEIDQSFKEQDFLQDNTRKKAAHAVRQALRWAAYQKLHDNNRHEFAEGFIPPFDERRLAIVRKFCTIPTVMSYCIGSVKSPIVRMAKDDQLSGRFFVCYKCGQRNPGWSHAWTCLLEKPIPDDIMLNRFMWPRDEDDIPTCQAFMHQMDLLRSSIRG
eukprot:Skav203118  [mRNA]  locus=scaffold447:584071:586794:+ [translate_table: standard]